MIQTGSRVLVKNWGYSYSIYIEWFVEHGHIIPAEFIARYAFGDSTNFVNGRKDDTIYKVLCVEDNIALIIRDDYKKHMHDKTYLVGIDGLQEYKELVCLTKSQIERILGYSIKIIKEDDDE